eukprot:SAG31_NODE_12856_length_911_cov_1.136700_3_plen_104_part_00
MDDDVKPWDAPESLTSWLGEQQLECERKLAEEQQNYLGDVDLGPVDFSLVLVFGLTENDAGEKTLGNMHEAWSITSRLLATVRESSFILPVCPVSLPYQHGII